ncbi:hypothetical protein [Nocardia sp. NPDC051981]|uniref:hypothetical protein n=1 Tax=Nocardia sp. NPDC051981 TaxID=3155417 RepID=UPI003437D686
MVFGIAGIRGNFLAGALVAKSLRRTTLGIGVLLVAAMAALALFGMNVVAAGAILMLWGLGYGAVPVTFQTRILRAARTPPKRHRPCSSRPSISRSPSVLAGGIAVDHAGPLSVLWLGGGSILAALSTLGGRARTLRLATA